MLKGDLLFDRNLPKPLLNIDASRGRPEKRFLDCSKSAQYVKRKDLIESNSPNTTIAAGIKLMSEKCGQNIHRSSKIDKIEQLDEKKDKVESPVDVKSAYKLMDDLFISKNKYDILLQFMSQNGLKGFLPSRRSLAEFEKQNFPDDMIYLSPEKIQLDLSKVIERTFKEIISLPEIFESIWDNDEVEFYFKLGNYKRTGYCF